jgi:aminoglycoside phosphotransferase (APT) family kinase protein
MPDLPDDDARGGDRIPGLDVASVTAWLDRECPGLFAPSLRGRLIAGGRSNLTYLLDDGTNRAVLRRPPLGHVLATAHDMAREHRVLAALGPTPVPVPRPLASCSDPEVTGAPFYVMEYVAGLVPRTSAEVAGLDAGQRERLALAMIDTLADLHQVDPEQVGLADFGRAEGFLARQVRRWTAQLAASRSRPLPGIEELGSRLAATVPAGSGRGCLVHGDFRLDNLVVGPPGEPDALAVRAVLDWEMSTLGDPLADVGLLLAYWDGLGSVPNPLADGPGPRTGFPAGSVLAQRYAGRHGSDLTLLPWYVGLGFFKIAVILEGIHFRYVQGQTVGAGFGGIGDLVPALVELGHRSLGELPAAG